MTKIAVLTEKYLSWNGGVDFIKHIILALASVAKENNLDIYIFAPPLKTYKNFKGIKRILHKTWQNHLSAFSISSEHALFDEFSGCKFVTCRSNSAASTMKKLGIDFFLPHMDASLFKQKIQNIGYLYDCQHKYFPEFFSRKTLADRDTFFSEMTSGGGRIIVNANSVKDDLVRFYQADPQSIAVLPFTPKVKPEYLEDNPELISRYNLAQRFFLISNQFWMHKDHATAFKAFAELVQQPDFDDIQLVCTGLMEDERNPKYVPELEELIHSLGCDNKIRCLGLIPKKEQIEIMKHAIAVIQPTLFEGGPGGGAVWDAISLGVPAIVSDIPTNLEIADQSVQFFKARDAESLCVEMKQVLSQRVVRPSSTELMIKSNNNMARLGGFLLKWM